MKELLKLFPQEAVDAINATTDIFLNTPQDSNTQTHSIMRTSNSHQDFFPLYGRIISEREILKNKFTGSAAAIRVYSRWQQRLNSTAKERTLTQRQLRPSVGIAGRTTRKIKHKPKAVFTPESRAGTLCRIQTSTLSGGTAR